jgi:hypothetical protein
VDEAFVVRGSFDAMCSHPGLLPSLLEAVERGAPGREVGDGMLDVQGVHGDLRRRADH